MKIGGWRREQVFTTIRNFAIYQPLKLRISDPPGTRFHKGLAVGIIEYITNYNVTGTCASFMFAPYILLSSFAAVRFG